MSAPNSPHDLLPLLDRLSHRGLRWLWRSRLRDAVNDCARPAILILLAGALFVLTLALSHAWLGTYLPRFWLLVALTFCLPVVFVGMRVMAALRDHPTREEALAIYDERLGLKDRLRTADAFLRQAEPTPFVQAAVADALPSAIRAEEKELYWSWGAMPLGSRAFWGPLLAVLCLLGASFLPSPEASDLAGRAPDEVPGVAPVAASRSEAPKPQDETALPKEESIQRPAAAKTPQRPPQGVAPTVSEPNPTEKMVEDDEVKETEGMTEGGQHSDAKSSGRSDRSQGAPGNQSPASKPAEQQKPKKKSEKKPAKEKPSAQPQKKVKDRSGATSGRGSSSGSSRNPASTEWSSKDRVEETEDQELEQEDEVDDEETESEARGGLQPNLRDRRPPVNRDLSIGFGNRANPDANGRGGPGQRKKSRGVASLVLGVPVPDHVKGQVNPGRVKITQERIQPKAERSDPVPAEDRGAREVPYGTVPQRALRPPMKRLVREFFDRDWGGADS